jgi:dipeptidyl aminopeptidase/acylaminoacyl peptidase
VIERRNGDEVLVVYERTGEGLRPYSVIASGPELRYARIRWANPERLLVTGVVQDPDGLAKEPRRRILSMSLDGAAQVVVLSDRRRQPARFFGDGIIHLLRDDPSHVLIRLSDVNNENDSAVYRLNIYDGDRTLVEDAQSGHDIFNWYADWDGHVRYAFGTDSRGREVMLLKRDDGTWQPLHQYELFADRRFFPVGVNAGEDLIYVMSSHVTGRSTLYLFDLATGQLAGEVFGHDEVDLNSVLVSEARRAAVGVSYTVDQRQYHFLDDGFAALKGRIDAALSGTYNSIVSTSLDESVLAVFAGGPATAGRYYLYDDASGDIIDIGARYPGIEDGDLAPMRRVTYAARDALEIPSYLTLPPDLAVDEAARPGPAVILPHGGPRTRDVLAFDPWAQFLASRGYVVLQPNFRGSRGYGERFEELGHGTWGRAMQDDLADAAGWLVYQGYADPDRICIAGASYGGYAAAMGVIRHPGVYQCAASLNGVTDVRMMLRNDGDYNSRSSEFKRVAGELTKSELDLISPMDRVGEVSAPILLVHGVEDDNVSRLHSSRFAEKLERLGKPVRYVPVDEEGHTFRRDENRALWLTELEAFLNLHIGPGNRDQQARQMDGQ